MSLKYIIKKDGTVIIGRGFHEHLAQGSASSDVISAGHVKLVDGKIEVFGESYGYGIKSKPEDAEYILHALR